MNRPQRSKSLLLCLAVIAVSAAAAFVFDLRGWKIIVLATVPGVLTFAVVNVLSGLRAKTQREK